MAPQRPSGKAVLLAAAAVLTVVVSATSGAVAGTLITSADIQNGTITSKDVKKGGIKAKNLAPGSVTWDVQLDEAARQQIMALAQAGPAGATGAAGPAGATGLTGATGPAGAPGPAGATGPQGATGATGLTGEKGEPGVIGATGVQGQQGETGASGVQGERGEKGEKGEKGEAGATGATGVQGERGDKGEAGARGVQGERGEKGETGATGATGDRGEKGADGADGTVGSLVAWDYFGIRGWEAKDIDGDGEVGDTDATELRGWQADRLSVPAAGVYLISVRGLYLEPLGSTSSLRLYVGQPLGNDGTPDLHTYTGDCSVGLAAILDQVLACDGTFTYFADGPGPLPVLLPGDGGSCTRAESTAEVDPCGTAPAVASVAVMRLDGSVPSRVGIPPLDPDLCSLDCDGGDPADEVPAPDLIGLDVSEATLVLENLGIQYEIEPDTSLTAPVGEVTSQDPPPGEPLEEGAVIRLRVSALAEDEIILEPPCDSDCDAGDPHDGGDPHEVEGRSGGAWIPDVESLVRP